MSKEQEEQGFKVTDKRSFTSEGDTREAAGDEVRESGERAAPKQPAPEPPPGTTQEGGAEKIDFPTYILSYYTQGLVLLGEVPNPYSGQKEEDLAGARHMIDILGLLKEKTKGNLSKEEEPLLEGILYELRIKYMAKVKQIKL